MPVSEQNVRPLQQVILALAFFVAKPGSTAISLVFDYGEVRKKRESHSGGIPDMENTIERFGKCGLKTEIDKRSGFWQANLTRAAQEVLAFVTLKGLVFRWKVMPFGIADAAALLQELIHNILCILRRRCNDAFPRGGLAMGRCGGHAQASREAKQCAHQGILMLVSCNKPFQDPCHSETREQKYVQQHIRMSTHGVKTGLG